jgi:hypothetical protein
MTLEQRIADALSTDVAAGDVYALIEAVEAAAVAAEATTEADYSSTR